jgi:carboxyl-terminal processing protease
MIPKKLNIWLPLLFSLVLVTGMWIGSKMKNNPPTVAAIGIPRTKAKKDLPPSVFGQGKLEELIRYIEAKYVDDVNKDFLVKEAIDNILFQLDPHSNYISADQLKAVNDQLDGSFDGIGIEFVVVDDTVMVVAALDGGPAQKAGVLPGDKIVQLQDSLIVGDNIDAAGVLERLKGVKGSKVTIGVRREQLADLRYFTLERDKIPVHSVEGPYMLDEQTGYLKIKRFSSNTYEEFMKALEDMVDNQGMKHLVLDLRGNPGGYLQEATNVLSQLFREKDKLLVYTEGQNAARSEYKTTGRNFYDIEHIAVLTDEGSASASEIIAGAIQDWDRGVIIGRRTFGKGLVQEQYPLRDGSAIRLTVARYYTPSGRCIQKPYESRENYDHDFVDRIHSGELYDESKITLGDTTRYFTNGGRVVFGGGGIVPDVFIPLDSLELNPYFIELRQYVPAFAFRYLEKHRPELEELGLEGYVRDFNISDQLARDFLKYSIKKGSSRNDRQWRKIKNEMDMELKAGIARHLWSEKGYLMVVNEKDDSVAEARKLMKEEHPVPLMAN